MKNFFKALILAAVFTIPTAGKSEDLNIIGIAQSIRNGIIGETTVTPSYCINTWDYTFKWDLPTWQGYSGHYSKARLKVRYDHIFNRYFYHAFYDFYGMGSTSSEEAFTPPSVALLNYSCYGTNQFESIAQSYTVILTCKAVTTGVYPPGGPYKVTLKTVGTSLQQNCDNTNFGSTRGFAKTFEVLPYDFVTGVVGHPNYSFAWPFQCWAGDTYLYK